MSWVAAFFSVLGVYFNAKKIIWCWPIWIASNSFWIYAGWQQGMWALVLMETVFTIANIFGWREWRKK